MTDDERALYQVLDDILGAGGSGLWQQLDEAGFTRMGVPEEFGGSGGSLREVAVLARVVGRHAAPVPAVEAALAAWLLAKAEKPWRDGVLTIAGDTLVAHAAEQRHRVVGRLRRVPYARQASGIAVIARFEGREYAVALEPSDWNLIEGHDLAGQPCDTVTVDTVLDLGAALPPGTGAQLAARAAALTASRIAGATEAAVEAMVRYSAERVQFGRRIGAFQAVQQQVAVAASESAAAGAAANAAIDALGRGRQWPAAAAQTRAAQAAGAVAATAHQVHGAIGVTHEHSLRQLTTRLWSLREQAGADRANAAALAQTAVAAGDLWALLTEADT